MTEEEQDSGSKAGGTESKAPVSKQPDPEIGPGGFKSWVRDWVVKVIFDNLPKGMEAIGKRIETGDLVTLKFVLELSYKLEDERENPQVVLESFAALLIREVKGLPAETGDAAEAGAEAPAGT